MKSKSRLLYKSNNTCFQTLMPVCFYGMSDGKMLVVFTRFKNQNKNDTTQEWVVAQHLEFTYDYLNDRIFTMETHKVEINEFMDLADNLEQRVKPLASFGCFYTNNDAQHYFNLNKDIMLSKTKTIEIEVDGYLSAIEI